MSVDNLTPKNEAKSTQESVVAKDVHTHYKSTAPSIIGQVKEGIMSTVNSRDPKKTSKYQRFAEGAIRTLLNGFKTNHDPNNPKHVELLKKWESKVNSNELLDKHMCYAMIDDFAGTIKDEKEAKDYKNAAETTIGKVFDGIEKNEIAADDMWKWQLLGVLAIASPFGLLNGVQIAMNIFGPVVGSGGVAAGTAQVATWGPTGFIVEALRVDDGIRLVLEKTPILSDILEVLSAVTTNESVQTLGGELAGPAAGPVVLLGIPLILATNKTPEAIELNEKERKSDDAQRDTIKKLKSYPKNEEVSNGEVEKPKEAITDEKTSSDNKGDKSADIPSTTPKVVGSENLANHSPEFPSPSPEKTHSKTRIEDIDYTRVAGESGKMVDTSQNGVGGIKV